eukprot:TRINITY_DN1037_c0_g1_i5.p1 TRINITY_DN1037_c0_g1~~TRINITY_DN1037_c0_g1_i5.p1  ORF type:complete len:292 (-),score=46.89 TRINITY_DN1037_c0_g1_i5:29-904(-)
MRNSEIALCFLCFIPYLTGPPNLSVYYTFLALVICYHLGIDKPRWQILPVYVAAFLNVAFGMESFLVGFLNFLLIVTSLLLGISLPVSKLPTPTHFSVGFFETEWDYKFRSKDKKFTKVLTRQKLQVKIVYPVDENNGCSLGRPWLTPELSAKVLEIGVNPRIPSFIFSHLSLIQMPCYVNASVSKSQQKWPVMVFSHGLKGIPEVYMTLAMDFASRGFIVVLPLHTDGSSAMSYDNFNIDDHVARNEQVTIRADNVSFALDQLSKDGVLNERRAKKRTSREKRKKDKEKT